MALKGSTKPLADNIAKTAIADHSEPVPASEDTPWETEGEAEQATAVVEQAAPASTAVAAPRGGFLSNVAGAEQDDGFSALDTEIGFGSFPMVKLDKSTFVIEGQEYPELRVRMHQARSKWILKRSNSQDDDNFVYSYDNVTATSGQTLASLRKEWAAEGFKEPISNMYMEVAAQVLSEGKHFDKLVLLNVAPASVKRLGGYRAELKIRGRSLSSVVTRCYPGDLIKISPKISFHPWNFEFISDIAPE